MRVVASMRERIKGMEDWKEGKDKLLAGLVRILAEYEEGYLEEMLTVLAPLYGEGSDLSIVALSDRSVLATTAEKGDEVAYMLKSIKELNRKCYYLRNEKNSIRYRPQCNCIRIVPLIYRKNCTHVLVIEQRKNIPVVMDRCVELLALATREYSMEKTISDFNYLDIHTGLPNRDQFIRDAQKVYGTQAFYIGLIALNRDEVLSQGVSLEEYEGYSSVIAEVLKDAFCEQVYCVGESLFAVLLSGHVYECIARMQDVMDICSEKKSLIVNGAVAPLDYDVRKAMYLCEKACEKANSYLVILIRDSNVDFNVTEEKFYSGNIKGKEGVGVDVVFEETIKEPKERCVSEECEEIQEEETEEDMSFFFDTANMDTAWDDI